MELKVSDLSKTYPNGVHALSGISLTIGTNVFGLPGRNGAGEFSLMRTIATLQEADSDKVWLDGINVLKKRYGSADA